MDKVLGLCTIKMAEGSSQTLGCTSIIPDSKLIKNSLLPISLPLLFIPDPLLILSRKRNNLQVCRGHLRTTCFSLICILAVDGEEMKDVIDRVYQS
jgi:hypothetical protein